MVALPPRCVRETQLSLLRLHALQKKGHTLATLINSGYNLKVRSDSGSWIEETKNANIREIKFN